MADAMPTSSSRLLRSYLAIGVPIGLILAATVALWGYYGTALFYEMILAGVAFCF